MTSSSGRNLIVKKNKKKQRRLLRYPKYFYKVKHEDDVISLSPLLCVLLPLRNISIFIFMQKKIAKFLLFPSLDFLRC